MDFVLKFHEVIKPRNISLDQIFNCDDWEKIIPLDNEDEVLQMIDFDQDTQSTGCNEAAEMLSMLNTIRISAQDTGTETQWSEENVLNWINSDINDPGFKVCNDDKICEVVMQESSGNKS